MATKPEQSPLQENTRLELAQTPAAPRQAQHQPALAIAPSPLDLDFCLVTGGPLYQLYLRIRLAQPVLELTVRRILVISMLCWLPLLLLATAAGHLRSGIAVPFLQDVAVHTRFLIAIPILIGSELFAYCRMRDIAHQFLEHGLIADKDRDKFTGLVTSAMRLRNSVFVEVALMLITILSGYLLWKQNLAFPGSIWYAIRAGGTVTVTAAGYWYALVASPILRFLILRWYFRLFIWYRFLWQVRGLPLQFKFFHPDHAAGLGFLAGSAIAFSLMLMAQTVVMAGVIGNLIWHAGATLAMFKIEIAGTVIFLMLLVLLPLGFFADQLDRAGRAALRQYGALASHYTDDFHGKWIDQPEVSVEPLLGTPDIQSLSDLGNAYDSINAMRLLPFGKDTIIRLAILVILPLLPLALTMISLEGIVDSLIKLAM